MSSETWFLRLAALPDPVYPPSRLKAGGDVRAAAWADGIHVLRALAEFEPGSVQVAVRFWYNPAAASRQERLAVHLGGRADPDAAVGLGLLLRRGPFQRFYGLEPAEAPPIDWSHFGAACDVVRRQVLLDPTITAEFNPRALPAYYMISPFEPNEDNDYLRLDNLFDRLEEPALIEVCVEPVDIAPQLAENTRYLARLQQINQTWDSEDDESLSGALAGEEGWRTGLKPLRQKDPLVDEVLRRQRRFHETLTQPHVRFHIRVFAQDKAVARLLASVVAESAFEDGTYQLYDSAPGQPFFDQAIQMQHGLRVVSAPVLRDLLGRRNLRLYDGLCEQGNCASVDELVGAFRLPVASHASPACIRKDTDPPTEDAADLIVFGHDAQFAEDPSATRNGGVPRGIRVSALPKHAFISGIPGGGKTVAGLNLVGQLVERRIPTLILEPAVNQYRLLKQLKNSPLPQVRRLAEELQVYTPGSPISPLRLNPLAVPEGIERDEHIENLLACFKAAMPMEGSMLGLLGEALEQVYDDHPDPALPPRMLDVHAAVRSVLASKHYSADVDSDLRGAFETRLGVLTRRAVGRVFQCPHDLPAIDRLMTGHCLIELASLPNEQACLLTLFLLTAIRERVKVTPWSGPGPRLVLLLEEAHNLVGRSPAAAVSADNADPKAHASDYLCRMLAELRSAGVAIIILDQLPSAVAPEVVKNTGSKLAFRQVDSEDREVLGGAMLFGSLEMEEIARLRPGEAFFHTEGYFGPRRIRTCNVSAEWNLPSPALGGAILPFLAEDRWFVEAANVRVAQELEKLMAAIDRLEQTCDQAARRKTELLARHAVVLADAAATRRADWLADLTRTAESVRNTIQTSLRIFRRDVYRPLLADEPPTEVLDEALRALRTQLTERFESVIVAGARACIEGLDALVAKCKAGSPANEGGK